MRRIKKTNQLLMVASLLCLVGDTLCDTIPGIKICTQQEDEWCWAGASECIVKYYIPNLQKTQKEIASAITTENIAPPPDSIKKCIEVNGTPANLKIDMVVGKMSWQDMKREADEKHPFLFMIRWNSGGYHCNVFAGFNTDSTQIRFMDPGENRWKYRSYNGCLNMSGGSWERSFKTSIITPIIKNNSLSPHNAPFKIISHSASQPGSTMSLIFDTPSHETRSINMYNTMGLCIYSSVVPGETRELSMNIKPFCSSGKYYVRITNNHTGSYDKTEHVSFTIVK